MLRNISKPTSTEATTAMTGKEKRLQTAMEQKQILGAFICRSDACSSSALFTLGEYEAIPLRSAACHRPHNLHLNQRPFETNQRDADGRNPEYSESSLQTRTSHRSQTQMLEVSDSFTSDLTQCLRCWCTHQGYLNIKLLLPHELNQKTRYPIITSHARFYRNSV